MMTTLPVRERVGELGDEIVIHALIDHAEETRTPGRVSQPRRRELSCVFKRALPKCLMSTPQP